MNIIKKLILPVGLILALAIAVFLPDPGILCERYYGVEISVIVIFIVSGYVHKFSEITMNKKLALLLLLAIVSSLILTPLIGALLAKMLLPAAYAFGLIVIVSMPPTLSSGVVITEVAEGNSVLAIVLTILLNLLGLLTIPFILKLLFKNVPDITVNPLSLFLKLFFIIFIPFILGKILKKQIPVLPGIAFVKLVPSISVVAAVWMCLSVSISGIHEMYMLEVIKILLSVILIHVVFLIFNYLITVFFRISKEDTEAFIFVVSQKTMPLAILVLSTISNNLSLGIIACVIYHFMQVLFDSILASFVSKRKNKSAILNI